MRAVQAVPRELDARPSTFAGAELLRLPVRVRGILLGRPVDLLLDPKRPRVLGLDVRCGDDRNRFLPFSATLLEEGELRVGSALVLVDEVDAAFYHERTVALGSLRGMPVALDGRPLGRLDDVQVDTAGVVVAVVIDADGSRAEVPCKGGLQLGGGILRC
jgi:hypothetical protein